jgi:hypothetical protein
MMAVLHEDSFEVFPVREDYRCAPPSVAEPRSDIGSWITYMITLYNEEFHLIARGADDIIEAINSPEFHIR